jgi:hypothetical protein
MATSRISEADAARNLTAVLARLRAGEEIVIESGSGAVTVIQASPALPRTTQEILALLPKDSNATIDEDFAADVAAAVSVHREPLNPPSWD